MQRNEIKACVVGASGYSGLEVVRLLNAHPNAKVVSVCALKEQGLKFSEVFPQFTGQIDLFFTSIQEALKIDTDVVFFATPDGVAMQFASDFIEKGVKVIDISGDFRFKDVDTYEKWYGRKHTQTKLLENSVYGLPELFRDEIKGKNLVANPGCYPTAAILSITPLLKNGYATEFIIDAKTGITGAGRKASQSNLFGERNECITPYKVGYLHKHAPEMETHAGRKAGIPCTVLFSPQVVPMNRGILETIYVKLLNESSLDEIIALYEDFYSNNSFIHIRRNLLPSTKDIYLTNNVHIGFSMEKRTNTLIIVAAIDNLIKGASGQAIQNMNIIFSLPEETGLL